MRETNHDDFRRVTRRVFEEFQSWAGRMGLKDEERGLALITYRPTRYHVRRDLLRRMKEDGRAR